MTFVQIAYDIHREGNYPTWREALRGLSTVFYRKLDHNTSAKRRQDGACAHESGEPVLGRENGRERDLIICHQSRDKLGLPGSPLALNRSHLLLSRERAGWWNGWATSGFVAFITPSSSNKYCSKITVAPAKVTHYRCCYWHRNPLYNEIWVKWLPVVTLK